MEHTTYGSKQDSESIATVNISEVLKESHEDEVSSTVCFVEVVNKLLSIRLHLNHVQKVNCYHRYFH